MASQRKQQAAPATPKPLSTRTATVQRLGEVQVPSDGRPLTTLQAMAYMQVGRSTLYRLRSKGVKGVVIGGRYRYFRDELDAYLRGRSGAAPQAQAS